MINTPTTSILLCRLANQIIFLLLGLTLCFGINNVCALESSLSTPSNIVNVGLLETPMNITPGLAFLEDPTGAFTMEEVLNGQHDENFTVFNNAVFNGANPSSRYWFRGTLQWDHLDHAQRINPILYLSTKPGFTSTLDIHLINAQGEHNEIQTGYLRFYNNRDIDDLHYAFNLFRNGESTTQIVGMIDNREISMPAMLSFTIASAADHTALINTNYYAMFTLYSALTALFIYNLCLWLSLKEKVYGIYLVFLFCATVICSSTDGTIDQWLLPGYPDERYRITICFAIFASLAYLSFVYHSLGKDLFPSPMKKAYKIIYIAGWMFTLGTLLSPNHFYPSLGTQIYSGFVLPAGFVFIFYAMYKGNGIAKFLLIAETCTIIGMIIFTLLMQGVIEMNHFTSWSLHMGFLSEALMLSLALAARTREVQKSALYNLTQYEKLYNDSFEGLFQYFVQDKKIKANPKLAKLLGKSDGTSLPDDFNPFSAISDDDRKIISQFIQSKETVTGYELALNPKEDKDPIWVSITTRNIKDSNGSLIRIDGSMIEITERKLRERVQKEALSKMHKTDQIKNEFLATVSHELRTPMNGILGNIELLQDKGIHNENTEHLERSAAEMMYLVDSILNYTQLQAGDLSIQAGDFLMDDLVNPLKSLYQQQCADKNVDFVFDKRSPMPNAVIGDKQKILKIIDILLSNALRFTDQGRVQLTVDSLPSTVQSHSDNENEKVCFLFHISDTGKGISVEDRERLFTAFSQTDASFKRQHGGLGLGLAICHRFSHLLGGSLLYLSTLNIGTQFSFIIDLEVIGFLPETSKPDSEIEPAHTDVIKRVHQPEILIVEDNQTNQMVLKGMLKKLNYNATVAENGLEALEIMKGRTFDLILMDCQMPEMDGFETTFNIRSGSDSQSEVPIIAVTANAMDGDREKCLNAGMNDYMKKPINLHSLKDMLSRWLDR